MQFIDLHKQYQHLQDKIDKRVRTVLEHGHYILGPEVDELETKLAEFVQVKHAICCANGTDALQLSLMALGINSGDAVFCPTFTFFSTAEVISLTNATPVFVDSDESTFNMCPADLEKRIVETIEEGKFIPKAIISVDLFGLPANYPEIKNIAKKYNLKLIEDAAQGFGGAIETNKCGSFGDISTTSFFPAKPLGCYGDGGAIFTNNDDYANLIRSYRVHGKGSDKYDNVRIGMNSRLDTIQAAILIEKLDEFPRELSQRNLCAEHYTQSLSSKFKVPLVPKHYMSSWAQYTLISEERDICISRMAEKNIPSMIYYKKCMHLQTAFKHLGYSQGDFPVAERLSNSVFSIPMGPYLSKVDQNEVINCLLSE